MAGDKREKHVGSGVSRRAVLKTGAITGAAASVAAAGSVAMTGTAEAAATSAGRRTSPSEDLILRNGRIHTMDGNGTVASVLAIRGGFVAYVGDSIAAAQRQFAGQPQVIDLHGRMAVPGLIDCHNHFVLMGNRPGHHTPLENAYLDRGRAGALRGPGIDAAGQPRTRRSAPTTSSRRSAASAPTSSRRCGCRRWPNSTRRCRTSRSS